MYFTLGNDRDVYRTFCLICAGDSEELVIGQVMRYTGVDGELLGFGHPGGPLAYSLLEQEIQYRAQPLSGADRAPSGAPCSNCKAEMMQQRAEFELEVIRGAIHWTCDMCGLFGIVVANDSRGFTADVRESAGIKPPKQMGVRFSTCFQHNSEEDNLTVIH